MAQFQIIFGPREQSKDEWTGVYTHYVVRPDKGMVALYEFGSPQEAAALVKELNENMRKLGASIVYMMKRLPDVVDYVSREAAREDYKPFEVQGDAYHCAELIGAEISFYVNLHDAYDNRRTTMKLGRYLRTYTARTDNEIADICARNGVACGDSTLQFTNEREKIKWVYENGPRSCMSDRATSYNSDGVHPAEAYATDDIRIAFIERDNRVTARAVVNEKEKTFYTVYGDRERIIPALDTAGYARTDDGCLIGCRLLKLEISRNRYATPYIDGDGGLDSHDDKHHIVTNGGCYPGEEGCITQDYEEPYDDDDYDYDYDY